MKKQLRTIIFCFKSLMLFACILLLSPQVSEPRESTAKPLSPQTQINPDIIYGIEVLYNWEFEKAENQFLKVVAQDPDDPAGYFYLAMVTWSRLASGFWFPETVQEYGERIDRAIVVAMAKIENEKANSFTYFYLGGALGFKGRFKLMQRKYLSSFFLALNAIEALNTCLRIDPNNKDVLLGLGIFDYYTERLSGVLKWLTYLLLHKGNRAEGLRKLHIVADEAIYSSMEAKSLLLHIYLFLEQNTSHKALPIAKELADRFPKDPRYKFFQGVAYIKLDMDSQYREVLDFFIEVSRKENSNAGAQVWKNRARYLEASYYLFHGRYGKARSQLDAILSGGDPSSDPAMIAWPLLKKGMSYDLEGEREKALIIYEHILRMKNGAGAQFLAEKYIDEPPRPRDPFIGY